MCVNTQYGNSTKLNTNFVQKFSVGRYSLQEAK